MLLGPISDRIGFFDNLSAKRAIVARCANLLSIRSLLHYKLTEATPDHSSLTVVLQRLAPGVYEQVFALVLRALKRHGLLRGKKLGIDASTLEANASTRTLALDGYPASLRLAAWPIRSAAENTSSSTAS